MGRANANSMSAFPRWDRFMAGIVETAPERGRQRWENLSLEGLVAEDDDVGPREDPQKQRQQHDRLVEELLRERHGTKRKIGRALGAVDLIQAQFGVGARLDLHFPV